MAPRLPRSALLAVPFAVAIGLGATATAGPPPTTAPAPRPLTIAAAGHHVPTAEDLPAGAVIADGPIYRLTPAGDRIYALGSFTTVGSYSGPGAVLSVTDGSAQPGPELVDGQISVAVRDGAGGWFLGGDFTRIGGHPAGGIAHVLNGGEVDTAFLPVANRLVTAIELVGDTLYVGGDFTRVDGAVRKRVAALSVADGSVLPFDAPQQDWVTELLFLPPDDGPGRLFIASDSLHAVDLVTGAPIPGFSSALEAPINALAQGGGRVYAGSGNGVVAVDPATGAVDPGFDLGPAPAKDKYRGVYTLLYTADRLYLGSDRTRIGGQPGRLVAVDPATGAVDPSFAPAISTDPIRRYHLAGVYDLAKNGDQLWAGGSFAGGLAVVDATTGATGDLDLPSYNFQVNAVEQAGADLFVGGHFFITNGVRTRNLAALDAETLEPVPGFRATTDWLAGDLFVGAGAVWVAQAHFQGYDPTRHAAQTGHYYSSWTERVEAYDPETGARIAARSMRVRNMTGITTIGDRLYVARRLQNDVRFPRNRIDVYDATGKRVDTFVLGPRGYITHLTSLGGDLVAAGSFVGSKAYWTSATSMLRINPVTKKPRRSFDPHTNGPVYDVASSRGGLVVSGLFSKITDWFGTAPRPGLSRMDDTGAKDRKFRPDDFRGNRVLMRVVPLGDLLWVPGSNREFLDATTGTAVTNPTGQKYFRWVTGTEDDLTYTTSVYPNLAGNFSFNLGFVAKAQ